MAVIHVLDKHTAELIAAGEVVERPASVVKELLENSIDAGATQVTVSIESGGVKLIEISDNGTGIDAEYISDGLYPPRHQQNRKAGRPEQHPYAGLPRRSTGFHCQRGPCRADSPAPRWTSLPPVYRIAGGEEQVAREPAARAVGTTIRVQDLFYNTPARMKFLKKDSSRGHLCGR